MRLWSIHPRYLDRAGLLALWREGLGARTSLRIPSAGYGRHPQLERFRSVNFPEIALDMYLHAVVDEAVFRGYEFDRTKLMPRQPALTATSYTVVPRGQLEYEAKLLRKKISARKCPDDIIRIIPQIPEPHPTVRLVSGGIAAWERVRD